MLPYALPHVGKAPKSLFLLTKDRSLQGMIYLQELFRIFPDDYLTTKSHECHSVTMNKGKGINF